MQGIYTPVRIVIKTLDQARAAAAELGRQWQKFSNEGLMLTIEPYYRPSSRSQKSKIHAMLNDMADHLGYERRDFKELSKAEYWPTKTIALREKSVTIPKSTAELTKEEASLVIEKLLYICGEYDIHIGDN